MHRIRIVLKFCRLSGERVLTLNESLAMGLRKIVMAHQLLLAIDTSRHCNNREINIEVSWVLLSSLELFI